MFINTIKIINTEILIQKVNKEVDGKSKDKLWKYFNIIDIPNDFYKDIECLFCSKVWKQEKQMIWRHI